MPANPLPEQLARLAIAESRNVEILDSGSFFQRKEREVRHASELYDNRPRAIIRSETTSPIPGSDLCCRAKPVRFLRVPMAD